MNLMLEYRDASGIRQIPLTPGRALKIGRGTASDTQIPDPALSRVHCEVLSQEGKVHLRDLGSTAGTFVAEQRIEQAVLAPGDRFRAGNTHFTVSSTSPLDSPTLAHASTKRPTQRLASEIRQAGSLGPYQIEELVNATGANLVFRARAAEQGETVAIKVLPCGAADEEEQARFVRAMRTLQAIRDPRLTRLYHAKRLREYCWVAMEWFEAGSLADRLERVGIHNRLDWRDAWRVTRCIAQSLCVLEKNGLVHRNIRPTNIMYRKSDDSWVLSDLIVLKSIAAQEHQDVTRLVFLPSNLAYTAPERLRGDTGDEHSLLSDIYSLGAVLTEILSGEPPFGKGDLRSILARMQQPRHRVEPAAQLGLNELFIDLVNRMTDPDPARRPQTGLDLWREVERIGGMAGLR